MNYILNTKTKKIEIFWDNQNEYQALINFISNFSITEEQSPHIVNRREFEQPNITWTTNNLPNSITISGDDVTLGTITCSDKIDTTITSVTSNITKDDITTALKAEPKEQYWLNGNFITSIKPREDKPENWQNNTSHCVGDVLCGDEFLNKTLELNQKSK